MKNIINSIIRSLKTFFEDEGSVAEIVKKEKKTNKELTKILMQKHEPLWIPSLRSFLFIAFFVFLFALLSHPQIIIEYFISPVSYLFDYLFGGFALYQSIKSFLLKLPSINIPSVKFNDNHYQNLIAIHAGIGAVLVGLAFFVAQSLIDKNDPDKGRVLLYKSHFFPLLTAEILIFLIFIWGDVNLFALGAIIILALFTVYFLGETINILIKDHKMEKAKRQIYKDIFKKALNFEVLKRIKNNDLYEYGKEIEKKEKIRISPFVIDRDNYISINSNKEGIIRKISFIKIKEFISEINKIKKSEEIPTSDSDELKDTKQYKKNNITDKKQDPVAYILPTYLEKIPNEIIQIRKSSFSDEVLNNNFKNLEKKALAIFTVEPITIKEEARLELSKIKDRCLQAIKNQETGEAKKIADLYIDLVKEYFNQMDKYGGGFSIEEAEKERTSLLGTLEPIEWLSKDIREIFEKGIQSDDINVIKEFAYLPIRIANEAIEHKDHLVFQEFICFPQLLYSYAYDRKDSSEKISKFMFDRTWRYLKELSDYNLESKFKKNKCDEENFTGFAVHLLKVFQNLIKASFDKRDFENFKTFLIKTSVLFKNLLRQQFYDNEEDNIFDKINIKRQGMFFGITSWVLFITESNKDNVEVKKYFETCKQYLPSDIKELTEIFLNVHDFDVERFWGWTNWELEEKSEGNIHGIYILEKLEKLYVIQSLKLLQSKNDQEIEKIELPHTRELAFLAEGTRDLLKILDKVKSNSENRKFVLSDQEISKVDKFKELLVKARKAQEEADLQRKRKAEVSKKKIHEFKKNVVKNFYESHGIRNVINYYGLVIDKSNKPYKGEIKKLGINTMFDKAPFFDESVKWHVHFVGSDNGFDFGRSLINGENNKIIKSIEDRLNTTKKENFETQLVSCDLANTFIISLNGGSWKFFEESKKSRTYIPKWQLQSKKIYPNEIAGIYKFKNYKIPVYEIYNGSESEAILVLDKNDFGEIVQYSPLDKDESKEFQQDIFYMDVDIFTDDSDLMKKFLDKPPDWLKEVGDQDSQKKYLKERVVIKIFERFEFKLEKEISGFKINIEN